MDTYIHSLPIEQNVKRMAEGGLRISQGKNWYTELPPPIVTVVTVVFNKADTLRRCIESVVNQSIGRESIEYIIIDGGSTDGTVNIIEEYDKKGYIDYYVSEHDRGIYHAMNKGIILARSRYITFINSDDYLHKDGIKKCVDRLSESGADICYGKCNSVNEYGEFIGERINNLSEIYYYMPFSHQSMVISTKCYKNVGCFDESFSIAADYDLVWKLYLSKYIFEYVPEIVAYFSSGGVSNNLKSRKTRIYEDVLVTQKYFYHIDKELSNSLLLRQKFIRFQLDRFSELQKLMTTKEIVVVSQLAESILNSNILKVFGRDKSLWLLSPLYWLFIKFLKKNIERPFYKFLIRLIDIEIIIKTRLVNFVNR